MVNEVQPIHIIKYSIYNFAYKVAFLFRHHENAVKLQPFIKLIIHFSSSITSSLIQYNCHYQDHSYIITMPANRFLNINNNEV